MSIKQAKSQLRKQISEVLLSLSPEEARRQTVVVTKKVLRHRSYVAANRVSVYLSMPSEICTVSLLEEIFAQGKSCFIPRFDPNKMSMVRLNGMDDFYALPTYKWDIKQPAFEDQREDALHTDGLDLVLVPGVAFSLDGRRLGHGKGYYDTFLSEHKRIFGKMPCTLGLGFQQQILDNIPTTERDIVLNEVLTA